MNDRPVHSTLRQVRTQFTDPIALAVMAGVGLVAGVTGPFSTFETVATGPRLVYWLAIVLGSYGAGALGAGLADALLVHRVTALPLRALCLGLAASVPATAAVLLISSLFLPDIRAVGLGVLELYAYCLVISLALVGVLEAMSTGRAPRLPLPAQSETQTPPKILERLPADKRGALSHMSMADHYVEVFTDRGKSMVLMRLADAIAETDGIEGMQIHRSHWVARAAVSGLKRADGRVVVALFSGETLPVSRSHLPAARAAFDRQS